MITKLLSILAIVLALLLTTSTFSIETTTKGAAMGGALAVQARGRRVTLRAHAFRPNRTYLVLTAR